MLDSGLRIKNFYGTEASFCPPLEIDGGPVSGSAVARLRGQFAFALSMPEDRLTLIRDRLGINKLFFAIHESGRVLAANYLIDLVDRGVPFEAIYSVPAGHLVELDVRREQLRLQRYFDIGPEPRTEGLSVSGLARTIRERLEVWFSWLSEQFGHRRICVCLSGGLDSSMIAALAKKYFADVVAYTYGFAGSGGLQGEDVAYAEKVAEGFRIPFRLVLASSEELLAVLEEVLCYGQDWRDFNVHCAIVNAILARAIAREAREWAQEEPPLVLTGDLMNEFLADYTAVCYDGHEYYRLPKLAPGELRGVLIRGLDAGDREVGIFNHYGLDVIQPYGLLLEQYLQLPESYLGEERAKQRLAREVAGDLLPSFLFDRVKVRAQIGSATRPIGILPALIENGYDAQWLRAAFCRLFKVVEERFLNRFIRAGQYRFIHEFPSERSRINGYLAG